MEQKCWKEEGGIKMKENIESRIKENDDGMKMKREFGIKVDDRVGLDTKEKVENKKRGKVGHYKSEKRDEMKTREAVVTRMKEKVEDRNIGRNSIDEGKKEVGDKVDVKSGIEVKEKVGHNVEEMVRNAMQKDIRTHKKEEDEIKMKEDIQNKIITENANKEIKDNVKIQSALEKEKENGHDLKEKVRSIIHKDVSSHRKEEDEIKLKVDIHNKIITRGINEDILNNVKVKSKIESKRENVHDLKEKVKNVMQKDVETHRKEEYVIKMKRDIENKIIIKDLSKDVLYNLKVQPILEKKKENVYDLKEKTESIMQKYVGTHKKKEDRIKMKRGVENKITLGDEAGEVRDKIRGKLEANDRFMMMERLEYSIKKEVECTIKGEKQNETKDVVDEGIKEKHRIKNKIKNSIKITMEDETGNKKVGEVEKTRTRDFVENIKEKVKNEFRKESGLYERIKIKGENGNTISKRSETMNEDEVVNERKEKVKHKRKNGVEDTRARRVITKDEKNEIKMKEDVESKTKEQVLSIKEKEVEHNMKDNVGIKIKGKFENVIIEKICSFKERDVGNMAKVEVEHKTRGNVDTKSKEEDGNRLGIKVKEEVNHKTKSKVAFKKEEEIGVNMTRETKIKKEDE